MKVPAEGLELGKAVEVKGVPPAYSPEVLEYSRFADSSTSWSTTVNWACGEAGKGPAETHSCHCVSDSVS
jgi:hypothetical protein